MNAFFLSALVTLFVAIDPPGCAPIFAALVAGTPVAHQRSMAVRSTLIATLILLGFALIGRAFLDYLGVSLAAFRLAGGAMLFLMALEMVFEKRQQRREARANDLSITEHEDISVFPMGMPMIAGPGAIVAVMLLMARTHNWPEKLAVIGALASVLALILLSLLVSAPLMRLVGPKVEAVISRILGMILAALAAQFVLDGLNAGLH
ncbi:MAG: MarC family protein, partial [Alphaproteobacteria bacterium]|nr:MarC family protein [Alphaproteobacteria bacterium]MDE2042397.1 MarC family protein [Alphaproteobacteria bacterium]MDE2340294.1 MarC family protein [Alphaproteobacteria bacterium]